MKYYFKYMSPKSKDRVICHCLKITESTVISAIESGRLEQLADVMEATGAGTGCTACHAEIRSCLRRCSAAASATCPLQPSAVQTDSSRSPLSRSR